jgi:hypothetical protein
MPSWRYIGQNLSTAVLSGNLTLGYPVMDDVLTNQLNAVTYSSVDDLFVAVGNAGTVITSPDGTTWTTRASGTTNTLYGVTYSSADDLFVAVGTLGTVLTSPDGTTWTTRTSGTTSILLRVTYSSTLFVAVGSIGTVITSPDGTTWTTQTSGTANELWGVTYSPTDDLFVAVGGIGTIITSPDGVTWTTRTSGTTNALNGVTYSSADDLFVAVGEVGTIITSPDGMTWTCPVLKTGDLFVAMIAYRSNAAFTLPSGWSLVATQQSSGNTSTLSGSSIGSGLMAYCIYDAASPPGYTFTRTGGNAAYGRLAVYRTE